MPTGKLTQGRQFHERAEGHVPENYDEMPDAPSGIEYEQQDNTVRQRRLDPALVAKAESGYCGRLSILIASGNWNAAKAVIDEAERNSGHIPEDEPLLEVLLHDAGIPLRECNALESCGVTTIGDLAKIKTRDLLNKTGIGTHTIDVIWWTILKLSANRDAKREVAEANYADLTRTSASNGVNLARRR